MEIRNSSPIYLATEEARNLGVSNLLTGDGSDELFAGYSFLYNLPMEKLQESLEGIWKEMSFTSVKIAEDLGIKVKLPFMAENFREFAERIDPKYKVGKREGQKFGKWILRKA